MSVGYSLADLSKSSAKYRTIDDLWDPEPMTSVADPYPDHPPKTEIVEGCDLRVGDVIVCETGKNGERLHHWDMTVAKHPDGGIGYTERDYSWPLTKRFQIVKYNKFDRGYWWEVRSPRPEPESNEFGEVSP